VLFNEGNYPTTSGENLMIEHQFPSRFRHLIIGTALILIALLGIAISPANAQGSVPFRVYFTFEDGPTDAYTPGILDTLTQYNAKATFLIAGDQINGQEDLLQREVREGHAIVNHLWSEPGVYAGAADDDVRASYLKTEEAIRAALGDQLARYDAQIKMFWQPGGGAKSLPTIESVQVITYNWSVNSDDCGWGLHGIDLNTLDFDKAVIDNVLNEPQTEGQFYNVYDYGDGAIIAMHDINRVTGRVLPILLSELQSAGATFEALPRPWDSVNTMPIKLGVPPIEGAGIPGAAMQATVLTDARVRTAPDKGADILDSLAPDTKLTAIGRAKGWIQVQYGDKIGWMHGELVKVFGPIPSLPAVTL